MRDDGHIPDPPPAAPRAPGPGHRHAERAAHASQGEDRADASQGDVDVERRMTPGAIACATPLFLGVALTVILAVMFFAFLLFG
jgi:hypothetical protein